SLRLVVELQRSANAPRRQALAAAYRRYFLRMIGLLRRRLPPYLCQRMAPKIRRGRRPVPSMDGIRITRVAGGSHGCAHGGPLPRGEPGRSATGVAFPPVADAPGSPRSEIFRGLVHAHADRPQV